MSSIVLGMMEVVDTLISSTPCIHVNSTVGMVSHVTFIQTYIVPEFLLALESLHGHLKVLMVRKQNVEIG